MKRKFIVCYSLDEYKEVNEFLQKENLNVKFISSQQIKSLIDILIQNKKPLNARINKRKQKKSLKYSVSDVISNEIEIVNIILIEDILREKNTLSISDIISLLLTLRKEHNVNLIFTYIDYRKLFEMTALLENSNLFISKWVNYYNLIFNSIQFNLDKIIFVSSLDINRSLSQLFLSEESNIYPINKENKLNIEDIFSSYFIKNNPDINKIYNFFNSLQTNSNKNNFSQDKFIKLYRETISSFSQTQDEKYQKFEKDIYENIIKENEELKQESEKNQAIALIFEHKAMILEKENQKLLLNSNEDNTIIKIKEEPEEKSIDINSEKILIDKLRNENNILLEQLHIVQMSLEKMFSENHLLRSKPLHWGAENRIRNQLSYRIGKTLLKYGKNIFYIPFLPFILLCVYIQYKQDLKIHKWDKLPNISEYQDYYKAEKIKQHLSYRIGSIFLINFKNPLKWIAIPFAIFKEIKRFRKEK